MIEAHVAGLARLGLFRFERREGVARVAGIASGDAEAAGRLPNLQLLGLGLQADLVAPSAALLPLHECMPPP
jgi:hypothetical protein